MQSALYSFAMSSRTRSIATGTVTIRCATDEGGAFSAARADARRANRDASSGAGLQEHPPDAGRGRLPDAQRTEDEVEVGPFRGVDGTPAFIDVRDLDLARPTQHLRRRAVIIDDEHPRQHRRRKRIGHEGDDTREEIE